MTGLSSIRISKKKTGRGGGVFIAYGGKHAKENKDFTGSQGNNPSGTIPPSKKPNRVLGNRPAPRTSASGAGAGVGMGRRQRYLTIIT